MYKEKACGTIMVLKGVGTQNNLKNSYNMNTKSKEKVAEIPRLHISFGEFE